ncbi:MAG: sensor histidine kinase [Thermodesulfobacteriota bacterium]
MSSIFSQDPAKPFQLVKFLSWSSLVLIVGTSLFIVLVLGNYAQKTVMEKDKDFALLLSENLNHQIFQRFTLPTVMGFGKVQLENKAQYRRLDQVVKSTIHGFKVLDLQIYDLNKEVSYSMNKSKVGSPELAGKAVAEAANGDINFEVIKKDVSMWSYFRLQVPQESYVLRTTRPLRAGESLSDKNKGKIIGILQFSQDITQDYKTIRYFQAIIVGVALLSSMVLFLVLYRIIVRADTILAERIKEKERLERLLHQNEKLASIGRVLSGIANKIKTPLNTVQTSARYLVKRFQSENNLEARFAKNIYDESKMLGQTVDNFLHYAEPKQPQMESVDLGELCSEVLQFLEPETRNKRLGIINNLPEGIRVKGDRELLYRALYNILLNACQAMDKNGEITLQWSEENRELLIMDTGPGFETDFNKLVEPFYTTWESGVGLGLTIAENILKNHGAGLELENAKQKPGAAVKITFPQDGQ